MFAGRTGARWRDRFRDRDLGRRSRPARRCLPTAVVAFDCRVIEIKAVASHNVIFGAVEAVQDRAAGPALVYHERAYKRV